MGFFDIHFAKPQNILVVVENNRLLYYAATAKSFIAKPGELDPHFKDFIAQLANGSLGTKLDVMQYQYYIGEYNKKNRSLDFHYIIQLMQKDGNILVGVNDLAKTLKEAGRTESYLSITGVDLSDIKKLSYRWA